MLICQDSLLIEDQLWRSKKQLVVARSSAEVEFKAMTVEICELLKLTKELARHSF